MEQRINNKQDEVKKALHELETKHKAGIHEEQVKKKTGDFYYHNIDPISFDCLKATAIKLTELDMAMSNSVIMRRALRLYAEYIHRLSEGDDAAIGREAMKLLKAAKGTV